MTTALQLRRGTTAQHSSFTGANGEVTVDTDKKTIVVHDGATAGGVPLLPKTMTDGTANGVAYLNGSKVLTTGSALTFNGSYLGIGDGTYQGYIGKASGVVSGGSTSGLGITSSSGDFSIATSGSLVERYKILVADGTSIWSVGGSEQMRLTSTGLGIGTSSPSTKLQVANSTAVNTYATVSNSVATAYYGVDASGNAYCWNGGAYSLLFGTGGTQRMTLDSSGNLGLGVTPSAWGNFKAIESTNGSYFAGQTNATALYIGLNNYFNGSNFIYKTTAAATYYEQYAGTHQWWNAPSGTAGNAITFTQAMTLDASGNLGIGTGSPSQKLEVASSNSAGSYATIRLNSPYYNYFDFVNDGGLAFKRGTSEYMRIDSSGNVGIGTSSPDSGGGAARWLTLNSSSSYTGGVIYQVGGVRQFLQYQDNDNLFVHQGAGSNVGQKFLVGGSERMRIDSSGNLLVGTASLSGVERLSVSGSATGAVVVFNRTSNIDSSLRDMVVFNRGATSVGSITCSNSATAYNTSSDYRLKENIQPMQNALATVAQLNPVTYTWKADGSDGQGFIAHELQAVVPDCVTGEKDAVDEEGKPVYQGIDTSFLVATLTKAIQELKEQVDAQAAEIAQLKGN